MASFLNNSALILSISLLSLSTFSKAEIDTQSLISLLPKGASTSIIAKNLHSGEIILEHNSQTFMLPASTQKVFTALASKLTLSKDFRFRTAFLTKATLKNGILQGDLIAQFSGDPHLSSQQLFQLVQSLKQKGIEHINGNLVLDTSVFTSHDKAAGWVWNDLSICFSAPPAAINIDHNCFYANLDANQPEGSQIQVDVPSAYPIQVSSSAYVASKSESGYCLLDAEIHDNNHYHIKGCLARQTKPFGLSLAIQDPTDYGANLIKHYLQKAGIEFNGQIHQTTKKQDGITLAEHFSKPLDELLKKMMKKSDNQIADSLFRTIAYHQYQHPASFSLASQAVQTTLKHNAKIDFENSTVVDGSGLSRHNQVNAETMLKALEFIAKNDEHLKLLETFPIAGIDGTLSGRSSTSQEPLANNLIAKTGALKGVYNLAGYLTNKRGEKIAFVQFINGYSTSSNPDKKTKKAPLNQFENKLYMALYEE